ncbi:MAG: fimbrillin family protein [Bacteroidales bacterium]|nr:fimbrillin family protein [Bacteroidales bacterium]
MLSVTSLMTIAFVIGLASCNKNEEAPNSTTDRVPVGFSATGVTAAPQTRTTDGGDSWVNGDQIGVFMVNSGTSEINTDENVSNFCYDAQVSSPNSSATFVANSSVAYFPVDGRKVDFIAYYPWKSGQSFGDYAVNVGSQTDQVVIDLLYANSRENKPEGYSKADGLANRPVELKFSHQLSKLILRVWKGTGVTDLTGLSVVIKNLNTRAIFNLNNPSGGLGNVGTPADVTPKETTAPSGSADGIYEAILLPGSTAGATVEFTLGGNTYVWNLAASIPTFEAGSKYIYIITLHKSGAVPEGTITLWEDEHGLGIAE